MMRALDLFCGAGGSALGLLAAGFDEVVGIDIERKHARIYPGQFIHGDALCSPVNLDAFDFVWASPPCQKYSLSTRPHGVEYCESLPDLIPQVRELVASHPFSVIENVPQAPIRGDIVLTGPTLGLKRIERRRHFETSWFPGMLPPLRHVERHMWKAGEAITVTKTLSSSSHFYHRKKVGKTGRVPAREACEAMDITTPMRADQVGEAVPPAYSEFIGRNAIEHGCGA